MKLFIVTIPIVIILLCIFILCILILNPKTTKQLFGKLFKFPIVLVVWFWNVLMGVGRCIKKIFTTKPFQIDTDTNLFSLFDNVDKDPTSMKKEVSDLSTSLSSNLRKCWNGVSPPSISDIRNSIFKKQEEPKYEYMNPPTPNPVSEVTVEDKSTYTEDSEIESLIKEIMEDSKLPTGFKPRSTGCARVVANLVISTSFTIYRLHKDKHIKLSDIFVMIDVVSNTGGNKLIADFDDYVLIHDMENRYMKYLSPKKVNQLYTHGILICSRYSLDRCLRVPKSIYKELLTLTD